MRVLNFGSLNIDYVYDVSHFVQAGETLSSVKMEKFCGGKGLNQSIALAQAGAPVYHAGKIGGEGKMLLELLGDYGVDTRFIQVADGANGHAIIQVDSHGQNCILLFGGANQEISQQQMEETLHHFEAGDLLVLQNEICGLDYLMTAAHHKGMKIALNPSPIDKFLTSLPLELVDYFLLNEIEGNALTGETQPEQIARRLFSLYPDSVIVLTLGKEGVLYYDGKQFLTHGIYEATVVDTTAAGDTFTGFFLSCTLQGYSPSKALELASKASSLAVSVKGAACSIPTMEQVKKCELKLLKKN